MEQKGAPIDWDVLSWAGRNGSIMELVQKLPRERWAVRDGFGQTLLHYACLGPNIAAVKTLVESKLIDVSACDSRNATPAHYAALNGQAGVLEILCAAGADLGARNEEGYNLLTDVLDKASLARANEVLHVLVANGARLNTVRPTHRPFISPALVAFEQGVLRCRTAVVSMLRVKRPGKLPRWDRFLLRELAYALWATRYDNKWQK